VFLVFAIFETRLPQFSNSSSLAGNIIFFLLINLNLILLVLLVFLVTRNLGRLVFERRRGIFGSRLRTRLVLAFIGLSLVPSLLLFLVARGFVDAAIENWFNVRIESSLEGAQEVAQSYYQFAADNALHFAEQIGNRAADSGLLVISPRRQQRLQKLVEEKLTEMRVAGIEVFAASGERIVRVKSSDDQLTIGPTTGKLLERLLAGERLARTRPLRRGDVVRAGVPVRDTKGAIIGAVTVDYVVPRNVSRQAQAIFRSYDEYQQPAGMKQPIETQYTVTLALITLVIIFSATWFGFQQAKSITVPLQRLEAGTREVAQGNWSYRIRPASDEETAVLVDSFNQMTADLEQINSQLVERRKYMENILANIAAGVLSLNEDGSITMVNRAAEAMLGVERATVQGERWSDVLKSSDLRKVGEVIREAADFPGRVVERQVKLVSGDQVITALVTATPLTDDTGAQRGIMLFLENVTQLLRVQRMEAWREVARRLAHEIKNPLTPIQLSAQRLRKRYSRLIGKSEGDLLDECTRTISDQVEELKRLVNEFSRFARLPAADLQAHEINEVVDEALGLFRQGHPEIQFDFHAGERLPRVDLDRDAMKRCLINLLDNAVAACEGMPNADARVEVATSYGAERGVVHLEVADNGCGMNRDVKLRLFEPYFSTKKDGTGLGLAIVSAVVADHQAYIRVQDNQPRGTRFIINFPVREHRIAATPATPV
jgi:two-component system nitrogen regulation sensor histidine kinase NtrY